MSVILPNSLEPLAVTMPTLASLIRSPYFRAEQSATRLELLEKANLRTAAWHEEIGRVLAEAGELVRAIEHTETAIKVATRENDLETLEKSLRTDAFLRIHRIDFQGAKSDVASLEAMDYKRNRRSMARYCEARGALALSTGSVENGLFFEAESHWRTALRTWAVLGDKHGELWARLGVAQSLSALGYYPDAVDGAERALRMCIEHDAWRHVPGLLLIRALCIRDAGVHEPAKVLFSEALEWAEAIGDAITLARGWMGYAVLLGYDVSPQNQDGLPAAERAFDRALEIAERLNLVQFVIDNHHWRAILYDKLGKTEQAKAEQAKIESFGASSADGATIAAINRMQNMQLQQEAWRDTRFRVRLRETIESAPDALFILDPVLGSNGQVYELINEFRNGAAHELCRCSPLDVLTLGQLSTLPEFQFLRENIASAMEKRKIFRDEIWLEGNPGRCIARRVVPVGDGVAITLRDATAEREAASALESAAERAREADRAKSLFLANMSHEVRTPINGVLGLARLLADSELNDLQRTYVDGIISSADILLNVIGDVLDLSKIEAGRVDLQPESTDIELVVRSVAALFRGQAVSKNLVLREEFDGALPTYAWIDSARFKQVLANLVGNAVKFTRHGEVTVRVLRAGSRLRCEVIDTGPGIDRRDLETAFEAFHQANRDAQVQGGTGLGLTISKSIVELMGGEIGVESRVGEGSNFWFEIPLLPSDPPERLVVPTLETDAAGRLILLVEDNAVNVLVARGVLRKAGFEVEVATNGEAAVDMALAKGYAAILMDVRMPGMDGLEATRRIRAGEGERQVPIIALTASALTGDRDECLDAGMDDYLGKPFTEQSLKETLARWLPRLAGESAD